MQQIPFHLLHNYLILGRIWIASWRLTTLTEPWSRTARQGWITLLSRNRLRQLRDVGTSLPMWKVRSLRSVFVFATLSKQQLQRQGLMNLQS